MFLKSVCLSQPRSSAIGLRQFLRLGTTAVLLIGLSICSHAQEKQTKTTASVEHGKFTLSNAAIAASWEVAGDHFRQLSVTNRLAGRTLSAPKDAFQIIVSETRPIRASEMTIVTPARAVPVYGQPHSARLAGRLSGQSIETVLEDADNQLAVTWRAILLDGSNYIRQEITLRAEHRDVPITSVRLIDWNLPDAIVSGSVKGSPIISGNMFFGFEHPLSESRVSHGRAIASFARELPLKNGQTVAYSSVIGVTPAGQLRREFLKYLEQERAHPYRTFLQYNTWYDLGYFSRYDQAGALGVIDAFGTELVKKRGVTIDSFLFDDGWDNPASLWGFNAGFPNGFTPIRKAAEKYGAEPGVWLSPWGGYGEPKKQRLKFGAQAGFEMNQGGFALSGPKYFQRFKEVCLEMMRNYGVDEFKFDGTGNADQAIPGSEFDSDFAAAISLIQDLRAVNPDLYVNLTSGTYPSPFWLRFADSIWRGGDDHSFTGVGSYRQRWITYRDADTFDGIVQSGPLFPLNSLMLHGLIYAKHARHLDTDPKHDFADEIHSYFGSGTQLQEMYVTPSLLAGDDWDTLAETAKWSRANADVLKDTHWIGGDPAMLEVYGWAAWTPRKGIVTLRNPNDKPQTFALDVQKAFELPGSAVQTWRFSSIWSKRESFQITAGSKRDMTLQPFEVLTFEARP